MDPDQTLASIRELINQYTNSGSLTADQVEQLVILVGSLDKWMSSGGFMPADWADG